MERRRSLKLAGRGHPLFRARYHPPIHQHLNLNSSGESTGGSSEGRGTSLEDPTPLSRSPSPNLSLLTLDGGGEDEAEEGSPYANILWKVEYDPKWRSERGMGRAVGLYRIHGEIGTGNFARVRLGVHQLLKERVAVKIVDKSRMMEPKLERMLCREVATLDSLQHPNVLRLYEVLETPWKLYLISEWAPAGDLYAKVTLRGRLQEREARVIFTQILSALTFMHGNGIVHRDLKAENIFFATSTHCKVGDFGFATITQKGQLLSTFCGSPPYAAPELFRDEHYEGPPVDVWALGVLLFFMVEGVLPFVAATLPLLKATVLLGRYELSPQASEDLKSLLEGILQQKPRQRHTLSQILRHHWMRRGLQRQDTTALLLPATVNRALSTQLPTHQQIQHGLISPPEVKALSLLTKLGVPPSTLEVHRAKGVRSPVGGVYRILLHRLQQGIPINPGIFESEPPPPTPTSPLGEEQKFSLGLSVPSHSRSGGGGRSSTLKKQKATSLDETVHSATCSIL